MHKYIILLTALFFCSQSRAEWFQIKAVSSYNRVTAIRPNAPNNEITIRIKNLENIEDIQVNRTKVLFSGRSALDLARDSLQGQLVWIENLEEDSGIYVGNIYLSYEQVVRSFAKQRLVGGQTVPAELESKVRTVFRKMLSTMDSAAINDVATNPDAYEKAVQGRDTYTYEIYYTDDYLKGIFAYESLAWYKETGQFLPVEIQSMFLDWLTSYQNAGAQRAKDLETKIRDLTARYELYRDFLFDD